MVQGLRFRVQGVGCRLAHLDHFQGAEIHHTDGQSPHNNGTEALVQKGNSGVRVRGVGFRQGLGLRA